jgi:hypothetical protein
MDSALMVIRSVLTAAAAILAFWGKRWAYFAFIALALLYFPMSVGFRLDPQPCEWMFDLYLAAFSLTNYAHIVLFAVFFVMTSRQFRMSGWPQYGWAALATLVVGLLLEFAEGISGKGHCRMRDLIPDAAGALIGAGFVLLWDLLWHKIRRQPRDTGADDTRVVE